VNNYGERDIRNLCTDEYASVEETKASHTREIRAARGQVDTRGKPIKVSFKHPEIIIQGKRYNDQQFWIDSANVLSNIEDIGLGRQQSQPRKIQTQISQNRQKIIKKKSKRTDMFGSTNEFSFG